MKDKLSTFDQIELSRRTMLRGMGAITGTAVLGAAGLTPRSAMAQDMPVVRAYGVPTAALANWAPLEASLGIKCELNGTSNDVGVFMRDIMASNLGESTDIYIFESGTEDILGPRGLYAEIDTHHPELSLWDRTSDTWKRSPTVTDTKGTQWGVPVIGNADSFGYVPEAIGVSPESDEELSWSLMFEDEVTRGRVAFGQGWSYSMPSAALYLKESGKADIANVSDMTGDEASVVADFLIERKKAGQFRTLYGSFEEQIQLLTNKEVDVINCWEPAVREANKVLGENSVRYAYTVEGYFKWGHGAYVAAPAMERDNVDNIYKLLNYFLDGEYRALQARDRGYAGPNMDLGVAYAEKNGWSDEEITALRATDAKVDRKFKKPFTSTTTPQNASDIEDQWQRFLNA
jgi:putative spermidine/putrescine transport system substrate-binding protein